MGHGSRKDAHGKDGRECPRDKTMGSVTKENLTRVDASPFGTEARRQIASECGGHDGHDDQVDAGGVFKCGRRNSGTRPWGYGGKPEPGTQGKKGQRDRGCNDSTCGDAGP